MATKKVNEKTEDIELNKLFKKIENLSEFKEWFNKSCGDFEPSCFNCRFWNLWNKFKVDVYKEVL